MRMIMINSKLTNINVSSDDNFLYQQLMELLSQIKLAQGGSGFDASLRRHQKLKLYAMKKQIDRIKYIEETFFNPDGSLDYEAIESYKESHKTIA